MDEPSSSSDLLTTIAIAIIAYAVANITHEIIGHCGSVALLGGHCSFISTTDLRLGSEIPTWKFRITAIAGSAANWLAALWWLWLLRRQREYSPALRYFLWLSVSLNLFIPSTYLLTSPLIMFGDWYNITVGLPHPLAWRSVMTAVGALACGLTFRICGTELRKLIGRGTARAAVWALILPTYFAGGGTALLAATFSPLPARWAYFVGAGGTFGMTFWLLLLPTAVPRASLPNQRSFVIPRSVGWLMAGGLAAVVFVGLLGPGFPVG